MNALYSWERDSLGGPHDAEAMKRSALKRGKNFPRSNWTCEPKERVRLKVTLRNLVAGLNVRRGGAGQSEMGLIRSLMWVRTEETTFTFSRVDWEEPFQEPFFKVVEGLLDSVGSFKRVRRVRPDGEIINIE